MIDLHLHSSCSDGSLEPAKLVERASVLGVKAIALTDHDTISGNREAIDAGAEKGVEVIAGVEISIKCGELNVHMLGYGMERPTPAAHDALAYLAEGRRKRLTAMVAKLNDLGIFVSSRDVYDEAGERAVVGRLHLARVLARKGYVPSIREAFIRYLGRDGKAYCERPRLEPEPAMKLIHDVGGVAVIAHPGVIDREYPTRLGSILDQLLGFGLDGLEAHYPMHSIEHTKKYIGMALDRGLIVTGGTDFHRPSTSGPEIGIGSGKFRVPATCLDELKSAISRRRAQL